MVTMLTTPSFWYTFIAISAVPYGIYPVAYVLEDRRPGNGPNDIPVWKDQSRAFMPGDFGLALLVTVNLYFRQDVTASWASAFWFKGLALFIGVATYVLARRYLYTPREYSIGAWNSPSKRYHDVVMFFGFCVAAVYVCLPVYLATGLWTTAFLAKLVGVFGLALWVAGNIYDFTHDETPNRRQHPDTYEPRWQIRRQIRQLVRR